MRRRKKDHYTKIVVAFSLFICISLMGVGYAYWADDVGISARVRTGKMDTLLVRPGNEFTPNLFSYSYLKGTPIDQISKSWEFIIQNDSTIPVKFTDNSSNVIILGSKTLQPGEDTYGRFILTFNGDKAENGYVTLETLAGGWSQTHSLITDITVLDPPPPPPAPIAPVPDGEVTPTPDEGTTPEPQLDTTTEPKTEVKDEITPIMEPTQPTQEDESTPEIEPITNPDPVASSEEQIDPANE